MRTLIKRAFRHSFLVYPAGAMELIGGEAAMETKAAFVGL